MSDREVVVLSGVRTAIGSFGGSLKDVPPSELAALVVAESVRKAGIAPDVIDHVIIGNVAHSDRRDLYISRYAAMHAGIPETTPAFTVNRLCGSGLQALINGAQMLLLGDAKAVVAGGAESMSRVPYWLPKARWGARMGNAEMVDAMTSTLTCPINDVHMGVTAENIAAKWQISREEQDAFAARSHNCAERAITNGYFSGQILPVEVKTRKGSFIFDRDEHVRLGATPEDMASLRPAFKQDGTVTAANASGINDAAAAMVLMCRDEAQRLGLTPTIKVRGYAFSGVDPAYMGIGPVPAVRSLLDKAGVAVSDIDIWEVNEAFAAQAMAVIRELNLPLEKVNPNGSGISLGHPVGATGAVISVKAIHELERIKGKYAVATLCIGGGQGLAILFERV